MPAFADPAAPASVRGAPGAEHHAPGHTATTSPACSTPIQLLAGVTVTETLPDWVLDAADEVQMIDQSPEGLLKRLRHGNIQPRDQVERALDGFFRLDTLTALRELTLRRTVAHTERKLELARTLGAEVQTRSSSQLAHAIVTCAEEIGATQVVLGEAACSRIRELVQGSVVREVLRHTHNVDIHVVRRPSA